MAIWVHDRSLEMLNFHPPTRSNRDKIAEQGHISTCSFALNDSTCEHRDFGRRGGSPHTLPAGSLEPQGSRGTPPLRSIVISQQVYISLNERGRSPTTRIYPSVDRSPQVDKLARAASNARGNYMATASALYSAQEITDSPSNNFNHGRAAD